MSRSARTAVLVAGGVALAAVAGVAVTQLDGAADDPAPPAAASSAAPTASSSRAPSTGTVAVPSVSTPSPGEEDPTEAAPTRSSGVVEPVVTYAGWETQSASVEVNGYVAGVLEDEGTCRLTLTRGDLEIIDENAAEPDASTMNCGLLRAADVTEGTWTAVLSYESASSSGESPPVDVEVSAR
ncbi:hypothetical protein O2V63_18505 [Modestobacter sp. VKM Ac-2977]|uniref:hypothetical protein n=1 Tax=Modestobacter sp. VKM Ac-2977 TaxID=3004131 RepID=UPI0022AA882F|nr:hypothetical protein [Modestobacter sp. VKM Ac-2977]MCZ2822336.1 hypothetical protein [Modestobacter sp. VKM Ac-2977]